jgi:diguanylate cyclase (GGDEF)-like protein
MTIESTAPAMAGSPALDAGPMPAAGRGDAARLLRGLWQQWIRFGDFAALLLPGRQPLLVELRRAALIVSRVRIVAAVTAALTLAWIAVDLLVLPLTTAVVVAIARALAAAAFVWLAVSFARRETIGGAYASLALLYAIATCFYVFALGEILSSKAAAAQAQPLIALYAFIPVMAVMGLALFPLTVLEVLALAGLVFLANAAAGGSGVWHAAPGNWIAGSWQLLLAATIAGLACANQVGLMRTLMRQAMRDPLTGCYSRNSMEALLELHFANAARRGTPLAVAFLDLDDFKSVNDTCGHDAGDRVLTKFAEQMHSASRRGDMVGRWGGEEFIVLFPDAGVAQSVAVCERMRAAGFGVRPDGRPVTTSIGLAEKDRDDAANWQALVEKADARMFQAKRRGKNCVVAW